MLLVFFSSLGLIKKNNYKSEEENRCREWQKYWKRVVFSSMLKNNPCLCKFFAQPLSSFTAVEEELFAVSIEEE